MLDDGIMFSNFMRFLKTLWVFFVKTEKELSISTIRNINQYHVGTHKIYTIISYLVTWEYSLKIQSIICLSKVARKKMCSGVGAIWFNKNQLFYTFSSLHKTRKGKPLSTWLASMAALSWESFGNCSVFAPKTNMTSTNSPLMTPSASLRRVSHCSRVRSNLLLIS